MMGLSGKCPVKCGSLSVTDLIPTARFPISYSTTLSTRRKGYLCGRTLAISSKEKIVLTEEVSAEISAAERGSAAGSSASSVSSKMRVGRRACWLMTGVLGAKKAVAVDAKVASRASFMIELLLM